MPVSLSSIVTRTTTAPPVSMTRPGRRTVAGLVVGGRGKRSARHGAAIPIVPVAETLKRIDGDLVGRDRRAGGLGAAQTPQGVRRGPAARGLSPVPGRWTRTFTDEAALLEACSIAVHVVPGDPGNLKVTLPGDLGGWPRPSARPDRPDGIGHDSHPFGPGGPCAWAGRDPGAPGLAGHSDGDVVLHAVADALLGAAGLGDLGRLFPPDARTRAASRARRLVDEVRRRVEGAGWRPASLDLTVIAARPRLASWLDPMRDRIATLLGLDPARSTSRRRPATSTGRGRRPVDLGARGGDRGAPP